MTADAPHAAPAGRELETTLVVDLAPSTAFGTRRSEKRDLALAVATGSCT